MVGILNIPPHPQKAPVLGKAGTFGGEMSTCCAGWESHFSWVSQILVCLCTHRNECHNAQMKLGKTKDLSWGENPKKMDLMDRDPQ